MLTNLFDGVAYGMVLFVMACGLSVTMGLMNFINLAHGSFAMAGGYIGVALVNRAGVPFLLALPLCFAGAALLGLVLERLLYRRLWSAPPLDQVLFSIGLVLMSISAVTWLQGSQQVFIDVPAFLRTQLVVGGVAMGAYRLLVIGVCAVIAVALQLVLARTRFGAQLRAAVDNRQVARGLGIDVDLVFSVAFATGSGLAGLGGALGAEILGLDPSFPLKFMVYFLIVVAVGGASSIAGPALAAVLLGVADVAGKYYVPGVGAFVIYVVMIVVLLLRPQGLFGRGAVR